MVLLLLVLWRSVTDSSRGVLSTNCSFCFSLAVGLTRGALADDVEEEGFALAFALAGSLYPPPAFAADDR
jgi:hypothetical protein